ncbi:DNA-binding protein [Gryllotalpicola protaetiae]|uniref:DNA-binding protein n=1 Tax=Gryllotalpicola protaetiae TaxID=2419771 RepID=A0A387BQZ6_9MICO|nr:DNA-binding protein [Gryllotalpicola protaetiae]AYG03416.1 DNA-binding protein [Gryllotalpicola protaetiae]
MGLFDRWKKNTKPDTVPPAKAPTRAPVAQPVQVEVSFERDEIVPIEKRVAKLSPDRFGLYPHEILLLDYAPKFTTAGQKFQGFWDYSYGVSNVSSILKSLISRGFIAKGSVADTVNQQTAAALKPVLVAHGLPATGTKPTLINRVLTEVPAADLEKTFPQRFYALTDTGRAALDASPFIPYIHKHPTTENLDMFLLSQMVTSNPALPWRDHVWRFLNDRSVQRAREGNWGLYRNVRHSMADFVAEEERWLDAIGLNAEVCFWDTSGVSNGFRPDFLSIYAPYYFPFKDSGEKPAPAIVDRIFKWAGKAKLNDAELRALMERSIEQFSSPFHLFTKPEVIDIVFFLRDENTAALTKVYAAAEQRFRAAYPDIDLTRS